MAKDFWDMPFTKRPDLTPFLLHLTKSSDENNAFENLVSILRTGVLNASGYSGYVKGGNTATCFMDVPFSALKYVLTPENTNPDHPKYEPFGIFMGKVYAYNHGVRPVLYLSNQEIKELKIAKSEQWRVVRFEIDDNGQCVGWLHEREWRKKGEMKLPSNCCVLVKNAKYYRKLLDLISANENDFAVNPRAIIPLSFVCQGFLEEN